jgi:hypothetical protein
MRVNLLSQDARSGTLRRALFAVEAKHVVGAVAAKATDEPRNKQTPVGVVARVQEFAEVRIEIATGLRNWERSHPNWPHKANSSIGDNAPPMVIHLHYTARIVGKIHVQTPTRRTNADASIVTQSSVLRLRR